MSDAQRGDGEWTTQGLGPTRVHDAPQVDDRYEVLDHLGRGGSGSVYRVYDRARGLTLAQKRLVQVDDSRRRDRLTAQFEREYHTLSELAHPSIIKVYDYGLDASGPYYTMELVEGGSLRDQGPMPWQRVCEVLYDIASSLAILHSRRRVHRDVSSQNVRFTRDGAARLIDFGLMAPMGVIKEVAGTPPFMAPETVQQQFLDGRADLFALGALAYASLTGHNAYSAKRIDQLRDLWRTPPRPISRYVSDVPPALEQLVMRLISLDRSLRPTTASDVMERVAVMLGRESVEAEAVSAAYLTTPTLVGRDAQLLQVRRMVIEAMRNRGRRIAITGGRGAGRSRFLDACVLEGKLVGATVVRVDAADGARGEYGGIRAIIAQLLMSAPEASARLGANREVIAPLLPQARDELVLSTTGNFFENDAHRTSQMVKIRDVIRAWVRTLSRDRTVMIAVDDLHRLDAPSAAILAAVANDADAHRLLLVATVADEQGQSRAAADWFAGAARSIELPPLLESEVRGLLEGVFGDVNNLSPLCSAMQPLCKGSPKACMVVAQHLVDQGTARYHAGTWTLPATLGEQDLPSSVGEATLAHLATLAPATRELLDYFAFGDGSLSLDAVSQLGEGEDRGALFRALDELLSANLLEAADDHYRLADPEVVLTVRRAASEGRARLIHARLAELLSATGDLGRREAEHRVAAGDAQGAIAPLLRFLSATPPWSAGTSGETAALLEAVILAASENGHPDSELIPLELNFLRTACSLQVPNYEVHVENTYRRLERAVGLDLLPQVQHLSDPKARAGELLRLASERFEAEGGAAVTQHPFEALMSFAAVQRIVTMIAASTNNVPMLEKHLSLEVFAPLIPALEATVSATQAGHLLAQGRYAESFGQLDRILALLDHPGKIGVSSLIFEMVRNNLHFARGMLLARLGQEEAFVIADELERSPSFQVNAWILRMNAHLRLGDLTAAQACQRRVELLNVEQRPPQSLEPPAMLGEIDFYSSVRDVVGMRSALERMRAVTAIHKSWEPWERATRAAYEGLRGNWELAEREYAAIVADLPPGLHAARGWTEGQHLLALYQLGRYGEVRERGAYYLAEGEVSHGDLSALCHAELTVALAMGQEGELAEARESVEGTLARLRDEGIRGTIIAVALQRRALLACLARDEEDFGHWAAQFLSASQSLGTQAAGALHAQLINEARGAGFALDARHLLAPGADEDRRVSAERAVREVLTLGDASRADGVHQLLTLLVERSGAVGGLLFEVVRERPLLTAVVECEDEQAAEAEAALVQLLRDLQEDGEDCTASTMDTDMDGGTLSLRAGGQSYRAVLLSSELGSLEPGAVVLLRDGAEVRSLPWELLTAVASGLASLGGNL